MSKKLANILAMHSSPAICGIKASNLINIKYSESICNEIEELNKEYNPKIFFKVLKKNKNNVLVLVYKKDILTKHLMQTDVINFLKSKGYITNDIDEMIEVLKNRLMDECFPHEIGVFLGYDLDDIRSFLSGEKECIYVGYWKVYSDLEKKIITFKRFTKCRDCLLKLVEKGYPLENFLR